MRARRVSLALLLALTLACAGVSPRAQVVQTHQGLQTILASFDDAERQLCFGSTTLPARPNVCSTEVATVVGLTNARHRSIQGALARAYTEQIRLGAVIEAWTPGTPLDMSAAFAIATEVNAQLREMNTAVPDLSRLLSLMEAWIRELSRLKVAGGGQ